MIRGEIYWADYGVPYGSEPGFRRPVIIVQNNVYTVLAVPLTTNTRYADVPGNVFISKRNSSLPKDSAAVVSQVGVIDKSRISEKVGMLSLSVIHKIDNGIRLVFGLD